MSTFDTVSDEYKQTSLVQAAAAEKLIAMLDRKGTVFLHARAGLSNFVSGAARGYTGGDYYDILLPDEFLERFKEHARKAMFSRVKEGRVEVDFNRLYFIGRKRIP